MPRFALLEHTGAPDDPAGQHFDLFLEDGAACRTWRLLELPQLGGPAVMALALPAHRLAWLDTVAADVSGNRGHVRRVDAGTFTPLFIDTDSLGTAARLVLALDGQQVSGRLRLQAVADGWAASLYEV